MNNTLKNNFYMIKLACKFSKTRIFTMFILAFISGAKLFINVMFYKFAIDCVITYKSFYYLIILVIGERLISLLFSYLECLIRWKIYPTSENKIKVGISKIIYEKTTDIEMNALDNPAFYDKYMRAASEADERVIQILNSLEQCFASIFGIIALISVLALLDWVLIIIALLSVAISVSLNQINAKYNFQYSNSITKSQRQMNYIRRVFYLPQYSKELRINNYKSIMFEKYDEALDSYKNIVKKHCPKIFIISSLNQWQLFAINFGFAAFYIGFKVLNNKISPSSFASLVFACSEFSQALSRLFSIIPQFTQHSLFVDNLKNILEYEASIKSDESFKQINQNNNHSIELRNVCFQYASSKEQVLNNISLKIHPGEKIAFVGENGAGKTTITKLLLRLYDPIKGEILIDGLNYKGTDVKSLRNAFSIVFQDFQYFALSIGENIMCKKVTDECKDIVLTSLKASGLYDKVNNLPKGIDTPLTNEFNEDGILLSGGECQKLAISRAIVKNSSIIILDEPSSSLDPLSEYEMYERVFNLYQNKTLILISHRLYSVKMVDKIFFIENGEILEQGNHEELMKLNGKYAHMYSLQANQYKL